MNHLKGSTKSTENTELAAALGAMDIRFCRDTPWKKMSGDRENVAYYLESSSQCGHYETGEMIQRWDDHDWQRNRPKHPLSYIRVFFRNRLRLRDYFFHGVPIGAIRRCGKIELITLQRGEPVHGEHNPAVPGAWMETQDRDLACALLAMGISPDPSKRWTRGGSDPVFRFMSGSPCGQFHTGELMLAWQDESWFVRHPEHPFSYVMCAAANRRWLVDKIRGIEPTVCFMQRNGLPAFLNAGADERTQKLFFKELKH